jgi:hypothetical protein
MHMHGVFAAAAAAGCLCKKTLGTGAAGLVHVVWNELGPDATRYTINNTQFTVNHWLLQVRQLLRQAVLGLPALHVSQSVQHGRSSAMLIMLIMLLHNNLGCQRKRSNC